jgi:hypothetical protein
LRKNVSGNNTEGLDEQFKENVICVHSSYTSERFFFVLESNGNVWLFSRQQIKWNVLVFIFRDKIYVEGVV